MDHTQTLEILSEYSDEELAEMDGQMSIDEMAWDTPEEIKVLNAEQRAYLDSLTPAQYADWVLAQEEEAGLRYDASGSWR